MLVLDFGIEDNKLDEIALPVKELTTSCQASVPSKSAAWWMRWMKDALEQLMISRIE